MALIASTEVAPDFRAPGWARTWCHERLAVALQGRGVVDAQLLEDVCVVVSELVTNAVRTGCAELTRSRPENARAACRSPPRSCRLRLSPNVRLWLQ